MARETTYMGILGDLQRLDVAMEANREELPQMEPFRLRLAGVVTRAQEVSRKQAELRASKQEMSRLLRQLLIDGQRLATVVRAAVKEHYGIRNEKLAEFGVQPFRGRKASPAPEEPAPLPPPPAVSSEAVPSDQ